MTQCTHIFCKLFTLDTLSLKNSTFLIKMEEKLTNDKGLLIKWKSSQIMFDKNRADPDTKQKRRKDSKIY